MKLSVSWNEDLTLGFRSPFIQLQITGPHQFCEVPSKQGFGLNSDDTICDEIFFQRILILAGVWGDVMFIVSMSLQRQVQHICWRSTWCFCRNRIDWKWVASGGSPCGEQWRSLCRRHFACSPGRVQVWRNNQRNSGNLQLSSQKRTLRHFFFGKENTALFFFFFCQVHD